MIGVADPVIVVDSADLAAEIAGFRCAWFVRALRTLGGRKEAPVRLGLARIMRESAEQFEADVNGWHIEHAPAPHAFRLYRVAGDMRSIVEALHLAALSAHPLVAAELRSAGRTFHAASEVVTSMGLFLYSEAVGPLGMELEG